VVKKLLATVAAVAALPVAAHAQSQSLQYPGFYVGAVGGLNWDFSTSYNGSVNTLGTATSPAINESYNTGWAVGAMIGYDFVGPRVEIEGMYRDTTGTGVLPSVPSTFAVDASQVSVMANVLYDFNAGGTIVPYIGAGAGVAFMSINGVDGVATSTQFAYQAIVGVGYNIDSMFRINLEGRYYGTTNPTFTNTGTINGVPYTATTSPRNNNVSLMASIQVRFGAPAAAPPPPPAVDPAPSFMVFFDWDRSNLSTQALATIQQAANAFRTKGNARITATGHADRSGPENYNMALSLRRANAVKDALVRDGVPATAISVVGKGETQPLVPTADGVREPQNRRVEIILQ
jgi:outer membrane protein OmpA-like peptidoglycan-associated protein